MQIAEVVGHAVSTVKHPTLLGIRLLVVQMLTADGFPDGEPVLALDTLGAGAGAKVIVTTDVLGVRELVKSKNSPARYSVQGLCDG
jgi:ethanolamine utilization protein EutN